MIGHGGLSGLVCDVGMRGTGRKRLNSVTRRRARRQERARNLPIMRSGNFFTLTVSLPWIWLTAITIDTLVYNSRCSAHCMGALDQARAMAMPLLIFLSLIIGNVIFNRRVERSGWILIAISLCSLVLFPYQLVWLTGGV